MAATLFFVSLLAHEGSHAVMARRHGVGVRSVTLWLFGGVAQLEGEAHTPGADFTIAAVGPGTSMGLAGVFAATQFLLEKAGATGLAVSVLSWLWQINLLLAAFNLIPAAPLDGGRILRAGLWRAMGSRARASVLAARAGLGFGVVLIGRRPRRVRQGQRLRPVARVPRAGSSSRRRAPKATWRAGRARSRVSLSERS